jgi:hypothetical protein
MTDTKQEAVRNVLAAVAALGVAGARDIAARAGMGYSTVTPKLRALQSDGLAEWFTDETGKRMWRLTPDGVAASGTTCEPSEVDGSSDVGEPNAAGSGSIDSDPTTTADGADAGSGAVPAAATNPERSSAAAGRIAADKAPDTDETAPRGGAEQPADPGTSKARRRGGNLRNAVLKVLQDAPEQRFKVSEVCKVIDATNTGTAATASAGAVRNALEKLTAQGSVHLVVEKPATFQAV